MSEEKFNDLFKQGLAKQYPTLQKFGDVIAEYAAQELLGKGIDPNSNEYLEQNSRPIAMGKPQYFKDLKVIQESTMIYVQDMDIAENDFAKKLDSAYNGLNNIETLEVIGKQSPVEGLEQKTSGVPKTPETSTDLAIPQYNQLSNKVNNLEEVMYAIGQKLDYTNNYMVKIAEAQELIGAELHANKLLVVEANEKIKAVGGQVTGLDKKADLNYTASVDTKNAIYEFIETHLPNVIAAGESVKKNIGKITIGAGVAMLATVGAFSYLGSSVDGNIQNLSQKQDKNTAVIETKLASYSTDLQNIEKTAEARQASLTAKLEMTDAQSKAAQASLTLKLKESEAARKQDAKEYKSMIRSTKRNLNSFVRAERARKVAEAKRAKEAERQELENLARIREAEGL